MKMNRHYDENYNYSILSNNLNNGSQNIRKIYRTKSPVEIQSYGNNNFVVELKYGKKNKNNDEYDFIENELRKNTKKNKAYTTYTQISNEESLFFKSQKPQPPPRYYKIYTNYNSYYPDNNYNNSNNNSNSNDNDDNYYIDKNDLYQHKTFIDVNNDNYQIAKNKDVDELFYPSKKIYIVKKNLNPMNKKRNEWKYQSFGASFLSNSNNASQKKILIKKDKNNIRNNKSISPDKKEKSISKSKNQLDDFNIDKLKEIGDSFALRYMNKINQQKKINMLNKKNVNLFNKININSEKKEKHNGIINKIIMIEEKRKQSKNKMNLINKTEINNNINKQNRFNNINYKNMNKSKIYGIKTLNENNDLNYRNKILDINNEIGAKNSPSPDMRKIVLNNKIKRIKYNIDSGNKTNMELEGYKFKKKDNPGRNRDKYIDNGQMYNYINNKSYTGILSDKNDKNIYKHKNIYDINNKIIKLNKGKGNENTKSKNINHNYLETINIKNNKKIKKTQHSFNNILLPLQ